MTDLPELAEVNMVVEAATEDEDIKREILTELGKILNQVAPEASFIPEVWQGHKDNGSGFWEALDYLERFL